MINRKNLSTLLGCFVIPPLILIGISVIWIGVVNFATALNSKDLWNFGVDWYSSFSWNQRMVVTLSLLSMCSPLFLVLHYFPKKFPPGAFVFGLLSIAPMLLILSFMGIICCEKDEGGVLFVVFIFSCLFNLISIGGTVSDLFSACEELGVAYVIWLISGVLCTVSAIGNHNKLGEEPLYLTAIFIAVAIISFVFMMFLATKKFSFFGDWSVITKHVNEDQKDASNESCPNKVAT